MFHTRLLGEVKPKQAIVSLQFYKQVPHLHTMMKLCGFSAGVQVVCCCLLLSMDVWCRSSHVCKWVGGDPLLLWESDCHQSPYGNQFSFVARQTTRIFLVMFLWSFLNYRQEFFCSEYLHKDGDELWVGNENPNPIYCVLPWSCDVHKAVDVWYYFCCWDVDAQQS
jgi:hypothetical protein